MEESKNVGFFKKLWQYLYSMKLAILLLIILAAACFAGSIIPQGSVEAYYLNTYGGRWGAVILGLGLDDVFTCPWFVALTALLCVNLSLCSILRFPQINRRFKTEFALEKRLKMGDSTVAVETNDPTALFQKLGFKNAQTIEVEGQSFLYGVRRKYGLWGSWLTHLGMLMVIVGFSLGQVLSFETTVYGVPGQTKPMENSHYTMTIDDFQVLLREDFTVEQYIATLTVTDTNTGKSVTGTTQVNKPMNAFGMRIYQNSTGWASTVQVFEKEELVREELVCAGEHTTAMDGKLALLFNKFFPDLGFGEDKMPMTISPLPKNPYALFSLYHEENLMDMNLSQFGRPIAVDDIKFVFTNPQQYTLLQVLNDPTIEFVAVGSAVLMLGLILAFYMRPEELWSDGKTVYGRSQKGQALFATAVKQAAEALSKEDKE